MTLRFCEHCRTHVAATDTSGIPGPYGAAWSWRSQLKGRADREAVTSPSRFRVTLQRGRGKNEPQFRRAIKGNCPILNSFFGGTPFHDRTGEEKPGVADST